MPVSDQGWIHVVCDITKIIGPSNVTNIIMSVHYLGAGLWHAGVHDTDTATAIHDHHDFYLGLPHIYRSWTSTVVSKNSYATF